MRSTKVMTLSIEMPTSVVVARILLLNHWGLRRSSPCCTSPVVKCLSGARVMSRVEPRLHALYRYMMHTYEPFRLLLQSFYISRWKQRWKCLSRRVGKNYRLVTWLVHKASETNRRHDYFYLRACNPLNVESPYWLRQFLSRCCSIPIIFHHPSSHEWESSYLLIKSP